jgi:hypothetical protein
MVSSLGLVVGIFGVLGLVLTVELAVIANQEGGAKSAYDSAPTCVSTADISNCRFLGPARIVRTWTDKGRPAVDLAFNQLGGRKASADFDPSTPSEWQRWNVEDQVDAELWQGRLMMVGGARTVYNPDTFAASNYATATWISGPVTLALGALFAWWLVLYRRETRQRAAQLSIEAAEHPASTQQLPLTQDMTSFLNSDVAIAKNPFQTVLVILGFAAVIPAFFSVVFILQSNLFNLGTAIIWATCLGLGGLIAWGMLHDIGLERRDLLGGVFARSTGPFSVKVIYSKVGTSVRVVVGSRALPGVFAQPLESIASATGTVDYLPVSGDLLEVRDESGQLLWSRFTSAQTAPT